MLNYEWELDEQITIYCWFLSNSWGNRNWITYKLHNSLTTFYLANYVIQHIIECWIMNEKVNYDKLLTCEHSIRMPQNLIKICTEFAIPRKFYPKHLKLLDYPIISTVVLLKP